MSRRLENSNLQAAIFAWAAAVAPSSMTAALAKKDGAPIARATVAMPNERDGRVYNLNVNM
jgi:hypothetical protein